MKCSNCGKQVNFLLAYKVKGTFGHYCSTKCAQAANADAFTSKSDVYKNTYRGGTLELIVALFLLPWWICKLIWWICKVIWKICKLICGIVKVIVRIIKLPFSLFRKKIIKEGNKE